MTSVIPSKRKIIKRASFRPRYNAVTLVPLCIKTQMLSDRLPLQKYMSHTLSLCPKVFEVTEQTVLEKNFATLLLAAS
jgi:hypothetical protein